MSRRANPTLIGAFVLGGLALGALGVVLFGGDAFWRDRPHYVLYFDGDVSGLQVGAPVMFRGVKIGNVTDIGLAVDERTLRFQVPVTIETDPYLVRNSEGETMDINRFAREQQGLKQGLRGRLRTQSFVTGQLYVDLDFYPDAPGVPPVAPREDGIVEIPTLPTQVEEFASRLAELDVEKLVEDLAAIAGSVRSLVASPSAHGALAGLEETLDNLARLTAQLEASTRRTELDARETLAETSATLRAARGAIEQATATLASGQQVFDRVAALVEPSAGPVRDLRTAAEELATTAIALRALADQDSATAYALTETLEETAAAARALRLLAEAIETAPESLWQGR